MKKKLSVAYLVLIFGILYIPILTLILFSFNSANSTANFEGFSLRWYIELFNSPDAFEALRNSLILAALSFILNLRHIVGYLIKKEKYLQEVDLFKGVNLIFMTIGVIALVVFVFTTFRMIFRIF